MAIIKTIFKSNKKEEKMAKILKKETSLSAMKKFKEMQIEDLLAQLEFSKTAEEKKQKNQELRILLSELGELCRER